MEYQVQLRTSEIVRQKDEIHLLNKIGKEVTACLTIEEINRCVYELLNSIFKVDGFGIALYNPWKKKLGFDGYVELGELLPETYYDLDDESFLAVKCFNHQLDILIGCSEDMEKYVKQDYEADAGVDVQSIIYVPLLSHRETIGVITIQAIEEMVYSSNEVEFLKNLSAYISIAVQNAKSFERIETITGVGNKVSSSLIFEEIASELYQSVAKLMDATMFLIGVYNEKDKLLTYETAIEHGQNTVQGWTVPIADGENYASYCLLNKDEIHLNFKAEGNNYVARQITSKGEVPESLVMIPLIFENKMLGVVSVQSMKPNAYSKEDVQVLKNIGSYLAVSLNNITSFQTIQLIGDIGKEMTATLDLDAVQELLFKYVNKFMNCDVFMLGLYNELDAVLQLDYVMKGGKKISPKKVAINGSQSPTSWCIRHKDALLINDRWSKACKFKNSPDDVELEETNCHSAIYLPLIAEDKVIGLMSVKSHEVNGYSERDVQILKSLAAYAVVALKNANNYEALEAINDELDKLSIVASHTDNVVIICSDFGELVWANSSFEKNYGFSLASYKENFGSDLNSFFKKEPIEQYIMDCVRTKKGVSFESESERSDGEPFWVHFTISPVFKDDAANGEISCSSNDFIKNVVNKGSETNGNGVLKNLVLIGSDITRQKLVEIQITEKNKDITDSINYASRIQKSMLPPERLFKNYFPESFIYSSAKDIVSGDFYWINAIGPNEIILAVGDCTGHGVPGAFLTIVANNLLNQVININGERRPSEILTKMNDLVLSRLQNNSENGAKDGMDISLCRIKKGKGGILLEYAGAYSPMFYVLNQELFELKGDRVAIGTELELGEQFSEISVQIPSGAMLYLFSDGYPDQLGGKQGKKFLKSRFKELLTEISVKTELDQLSELNNSLLTWMQNFGQTDDVTVIGVRV